MRPFGGRRDSGLGYKRLLAREADDMTIADIRAEFGDDAAAVARMLNAANRRNYVASLRGGVS